MDIRKDGERSAGNGTHRTKHLPSSKESPPLVDHWGNHVFSSSMIEGSLDVKLPTIWTDEKQRWEESEKRRKEERRSGKRKSQKTDFSEAAGARKGSKVAQHCNTMFFPMICRSGGLKSRLAEATGVEPCGQMNRWSGKIAKCIGTRPPGLHSTFHFWRKSRRIASQTCFLFDVIKFKSWGSLTGFR